MNWSKPLTTTIKHWFDKLDNANVTVEDSNLRNQAHNLNTENNNLKREVESLTKYSVDLMKKNEDLNDELNILVNGEQLEQYWNNKIPPTILYWKARPLLEEYGDGSWNLLNMVVDLRTFFTTDSSLQTFTGTNDKKAEQCFEWVRKNITYTVDDKGEFWQFPFETNQRRKGDCEDGAILMANMMLMSGVLYWRIRLNKGMVQGGYHVWLTYLRESDNQWVILDWCYWAVECRKLSKLWKDGEKYFTVDSSWNSKYCFKKLEK